MEAMPGCAGSMLGEIAPGRLQMQTARGMGSYFLLILTSKSDHLLLLWELWGRPVQELL
jgi:hypothetical protein